MKKLTKRALLPLLVAGLGTTASMSWASAGTCFTFTVFMSAETTVNGMDLRRLTGQIALRLWLVVLVVGAAGLALLWLGVGFGMALTTIAILAAPVTMAFALRRPAPTMPRWLTVPGAVGSVVGLGWLLLSPGEVPAILTLAISVWLLIVGLIAGVAVGVAK